MQKITPFLWFEKDADQIVDFYRSVFDLKINDKTVMENTPSGRVEIVNLQVLGYNLTLMTAGPLFKFTPAISFLIVCTAAQDVDHFWRKLSDGGSTLMPLDRYPFSEKYGWLQDRYGLSWQVILMPPNRDIKQRIVPTLMFTQKQAGKAEEAIKLYTSTFKNSGIGDVQRYGKNQEPDKEGTIQYMGFSLEGQQFAAMDSAREHKFSFNEAISLEVHCESQQELDAYWSKLSADPKAEVCGWLKDPYGVSWQIVPAALSRMLKDPDKQKVARVTEAFLKMKKLDIEALNRAYKG